MLHSQVLSISGVSVMLRSQVLSIGQVLSICEYSQVLSIGGVSVMLHSQVLSIGEYAEQRERYSKIVYL